jgi:para-nitrobenzyl esterase
LYLRQMHVYSRFSILILGVFFFVAQAHAQFEQVAVDGGLISGTVEPQGDIHVFKGIPFAAPPVGVLRWREPQPVLSWAGVRKCDSFGPSPMQGKPVPFSMWSQEFLIPASPISEDCLYLNIWTGAKSAGERRPVLVWIYGGGFVSGGSGVPIYDGAAMARKGVIFVSINYRVGIFGFFAHPELSLESGHHASGNYGLLDQIAALKWVQKNIGAFGGDPENVTIAGQSAGSMSVNCLVASPLAKGLFEKAIGQSGGMFVGEMTSLLDAENAGQKTMEALKAESVKDLRAMPGEELMKRAQGTFRPIVDGYVLPDAVVNIFKAGKENKVGLLTGWTKDEVAPTIKNARGYEQEVGARYGGDSAAVLELYPASTDSEAAVSQRRLARDEIIGVHNYAWANLESDQGQRVFVYRFTRKPPATGVYVKYGAFHTADVPYAFDNLRFVNRPWQPVDDTLAEVMSSYWANFVRTGDPNGAGLPRWPRYTTADKLIMVLGDKQESESIPDSGELDFLYNRR